MFVFSKLTYIYIYSLKMTDRHLDFFFLIKMLAFCKKIKTYGGTISRLHTAMIHIHEAGVRNI